MAGLRDSLWAEVRRLSAELAPAGVEGVRTAYEKLSAVYQSKGAEKPEARVALWIDSFQDWPRCALAQAVHAWSLKDTAFMPTTGQFYANGISAIDKRRADLTDVRHILRVMEKPKDKDWDSFAADPDVTRKLHRLWRGLRDGENLKALREAGEI